MDTFDFNLEDMQTCLMGMNDPLVLEWRLNRFSLRKRLKRQFLKCQVPGNCSIRWPGPYTANGRCSSVRSLPFPNSYCTCQGYCDGYGRFVDSIWPSEKPYYGRSDITVPCSCEYPYYNYSDHNLSYKYPSDLQSIGGSVWLYCPEHARVTHEGPHHNKRQDRVSFYDFKGPNNRVRGGQTGNR